MEQSRPTPDSGTPTPFAVESVDLGAPSVACENCPYRQASDLGTVPVESVGIEVSSDQAIEPVNGTSKSSEPKWRTMLHPQTPGDMRELAEMQKKSAQFRQQLREQYENAH